MYPNLTSESCSYRSHV